MYATKNYQSKKQLKDDVAKGVEVRLFAPGLGAPKDNGTQFVSGPHYPAAHKFYAEVTVKDGRVVKVK